MAGRPLATLLRPKLTPVFLNLDACSHTVRSLASVARLSGPVRDAVAARPSVRPSVRLSGSLSAQMAVPAGSLFTGLPAAVAAPLKHR